MIMIRRLSVGFVSAVVVAAVGLCGCAPAGPKPAPTAIGRYDAAKRLYERAKYPEAVAALESWLQDYAKTPLEPAALYTLARSQYRAGDAKKAEATYQRLAQDYKDTRWAAFAAEDLSTVTAPLPNLPEFRRKARWWAMNFWLLPKPPAVTEFESARAHFAKARYQEAILGFRTAAEENPANPIAPAAWYWVARSHEELALRDADAAQRDKAREIYQLVLTKFPGTEWEKHAREGLRRLSAGH
jgi:TolA-binding protein